MEKIAGIIIRARYPIIGAVLLITILLGSQIRHLEVDPDVLGYLPGSDRAAALFKEIGEEYGGNEMVIIGLEDKDVFTPAMLELIRQVTDSVRTVPGVSHVTSLTNVLDIGDSEWGIEIGRLVDEFDIPRDSLRLEQLREYTLSKDMYRGNLVSADATATLVIAKIMGAENRSDIVLAIQEKISGIPFEGNIYYGGMPVTLLELSKVIMRDITFIAPLAFVFICLVLLAGFRSLRGLILPMLAVGISITWTMGLIGWLGYQITLMTNVIPVVLLAVGSAYAIHVVNAFERERRRKPERALLRSLAYVAVPVFLASLTTVFGFLSFIPGAYMTMIVEFGMFMAIGILLSLLMAVVFIPALLAAGIARPTTWAAARAPKITGESILDKPSVFDHVTRLISLMVFKHRRLLLAAWGVVFLLSLMGISRIERRVDLVDYFQEDNVVQRSEALLQEKFNGSMPLYVTVKGNVQSPEVLQMMQKTQDFMAQFPYIPYSQSVADLIRQMNEVMTGEDAIPDDEVQIIQLWFLLDGQDIMDQLVRPDYSEGVVQAYVNSTDLEVLREIEISFEKFTRENQTDAYSLEVTGIPIMFKRVDDSIIQSQTYSLIIAILFVILFISLLQRSFMKGLLATIPIGVTLVVLFGSMGNAGIPLDIATVLTGSVTIGIGIDYAIHFITFFGEMFRKKRDLRQAVDDSIRFSGRAILINMSAVTAGFAMLLFSNLVPLQRFGLLLAVTMMVAAMASLSLLPLALLISEKWMQKLFGNHQKPKP